MATLAELKLIVDSSQLEHAKKVLDEFGVSASNVESSSERIGKGVKSAGDETEGFSSKAQRLISKATEMVETFNQGSAGVLSYRASLEGVGSIVDPLVGKFNSLKDTQKEYVEVSKEIVRSQQRVDSERLKMISSLKEEIALFGKSKEEIRLYRAEQLGIIDSVAPLVKELEGLKRAKEEQAIAGIESAKSEKKAREEALKLAKEEAAEQALKIERARNLQAINSQLAAHEKQMAEQRKSSLKKDEEIAELRAAQEGSRLLAEEKRKLAEQAKQNAIATQKEKDEFVKLRGEIDPVKDAYEKLYVQLEKLENIRKKTKSAAQIAELDELEAAVHRNIKQLDTLGATTGKTAKEMAFSMRGLPAQFTDIVVSLQGGQKPLTVLLQQGGQIKDMFGGIVPAFKSMASYVMGLLTPLNLLIASVGVLAVGYYRGASQVEGLNKSIISSGKIATVSSGQLLNYAEASSQAYGTVSQAIPVVSQLSAETSLAEESIVKITSATLAWSDASGMAVEDIIKDFVSLGKEPVKAAEELNKQYKFLTVSLYENIRALEESGRAVDATKVASAALAEAIEDDARLMVLSLGTVATAWHKIKGVASSALDSLDSLGRVRTEQIGVQAQLDYNKALEEYNQLMERKRKGFAIGINGERRAAETLKEAKENLDAFNRAQERSLNQPVVSSLENINKSYEAVRDRVSKAEKALADFDAQSKAALSSDTITAEGTVRAAEVRAKLQREYTDAKREEAGIDLVAGAQASLDLAKQELETGKKVSIAQQEYNNLSKEFEQIQRNINDGGLLSLTLDERRKYNNKETLLSIAKEKVEVEKANEARKDSLRLSKSLGRDDAASKMLQSVVRQSEVLKEQLSIGRTLGAEEKKLVELKQRLSDLELKSKQGILTLDEKSILNNKEALLLAQEENTELEKRIRIKKREVDLEKFKQGLQESLITSKGGDTAREGFGVGDKEAGRIKERNELLKEEAKARRDIENARTLAKGEGGYDPEEFDGKLAALEEYYSKRKGMLEEYYEVEDEMQGDWLAGMQSGFETFLENQEDLYTTMKDMTENLLTTLSEGISDSISNAIISGESLNESMYKLGETIRNQLISSLVEMAVQYSINAAAEILAIKTVESAKRAEMVTTATMAKTQTLANASVQATAGASTAAAWSPAAIAASIGSFGAAAAVGLAAVVAAMASFGGFKSGGFTGNMGVNDVAGVVHGQEYVFDAASTARIGVGNLEKLRSGGDFQQGGSDSAGSVRGSRTTNVNQVINVSGEVDNRTANQISYETYSRQRRAEARFNR